VPRTLAEVVTAAVEAQRSELAELVRRAVDVELERMTSELVEAEPEQPEQPDNVEAPHDGTLVRDAATVAQVVEAGAAVVAAAVMVSEVSPPCGSPSASIPSAQVPSIDTRRH
jgi:hypothetical protein